MKNVGITKQFFLFFWRIIQSLTVMASLFYNQNKNEAVIYFGGARGGNNGGPKVKVKRLSQQFNNRNFGFNVVYLLSNATYLTKSSLHLLKNKNIPIILNQNGVYLPSWFDGDWLAMNSKMAEGYHTADYVFWQSEFCRQVADRYLGERQGEGEILYNAVDTKSHFVPRQLKPTKRFTFLITGKINSHLYYRLESSILGLKSASELGLEAELLISGSIDQSSLAAGKKLSERLGLSQKVKFTGSYTQEEAPSIYQDADAYLMTKYSDPCPNTVIEAMACGLPVLYSKSGGVPELVGEKAGIGMEVPHDLENNVRTPSPDVIGLNMLKIAENVVPMGVAARERAETYFDIECWFERHTAIFEHFLREKS